MRELLYSIIDLTRKEMLEKIENKLKELHKSSVDSDDFRSRCSRICFVESGYDVYLFDGNPVFYTHFWFEENGTKIMWAISDGEPPFDWNVKRPHD